MRQGGRCKWLLDKVDARIEYAVMVNVFADQPSQHVLHTMQQVVEVQHPRLQDLLAAEAQELLGQRRRPIGSLINVS